MMRSILPLFVIICLIYSTQSASTDDTYPDLSCYSHLDTLKLEEYTLHCKLELQNPVNKQCFKACMLERLGIIYPPEDQQLNIRNYRPFRTNSADRDSYWHLELVMDGKKEPAVAMVDSILKNCGEMMQRLMVTQQTGCENWDPIYTCVQNASCSKGVVAHIPEPSISDYPNLSCHDEYKREEFQRSRDLCDRDVHLPTRNHCFKACMLQRLFIYILPKSVGQPLRLAGSKATNEEEQKPFFQTLERGLTGNDVLAKLLINKMGEKCTPIFDKIVNHEKRPCGEWKELYDCIEKYLGCEGL